MHGAARCEPREPKVDAAFFSVLRHNDVVAGGSAGSGIMIELRGADRSWLRVVAVSSLMLGASGCGDDDHGPQGPHLGHEDAGERSIPCPPETPELRQGLETLGKEGNVLSRVVDAMPIPARLRRNDWVVEFLDADGEPLADVEVDDATPWMRAPGHPPHDGIYPTQVTPLDEPGRFEIARLNLWMEGPWEIEIRVRSETAGNDLIVIPTCNTE
jgi:hypothetical protein